MFGLMPVVLMLVLAAVAGFVGYLLGLRAGQAERPDRLPAAPGAGSDAEEFIEHLREVSWQHRDIAPELSTILLDEIAQRRRRELG